MLKQLKYEFDDWEQRILSFADGAIECAIASAYLSPSGVNLLKKISLNLANTVASSGSCSKIRVILSDRFASTREEQSRILNNLLELPGVEVRVYHSGELQHWKNYIFHANDEIRVIVGSVNTTANGLFHNLEIAALCVHDREDLEVAKLLNEFDSIWSRAKTSKEYLEVLMVSDFPPRFQVGDNVRYTGTGKVGTVNQLLKGMREYQYRVMIDGKPRVIAEKFLEPFVDVETNLIQEFNVIPLGDYEDYQLFHTWFRLSKPIESNLYSYLGSKTIFNPHQFKPLLRFLSPGSDERLFIGDEVGVGKTIETGIIIKELMARGEIDSTSPILIVCPRSLGPKWVKEMRERFLLDFHLHDGKTLKHTLNEVLQTGKVPQKYIFSIVGLQLIRSEDYISLLSEIDSRREETLFGLVVIDESHHLRNTETDSNEVGYLLSGMAERMLMLSATPLNLKNEDLYNQMHILNPNAFPDLATFTALHSPSILLNRIKNLMAKNTVESRRELSGVLLNLSYDPLGRVICGQTTMVKFVDRLKNPRPFVIEEVIDYERQLTMLSPLYSSFTRTRKREALQHQVTREVWELPVILTDREMRFHDNVLEVLKNYYLQRGNSPEALGFLVNSYRRMISSSIPAMREYLEWSIREDRVYSNDDEYEEVEDDSESKTKQLDPILREKFLEMISEAKRLEGSDSKYNQFKQMLDKIRSDPRASQVIVFSFFVRTLEYLKRRLESDGYRVGIIHGKIPLIPDGVTKDRYQVMDDFKIGVFDILLSSEVGEQGLDFQYCHVIINYDLPYNPMKIEQRIGRVDRFGQLADKIIVSNLYLKGTVDEEIYDRLYKRIRIAEDGVGALEPIMGKEISDLQSMIISGNLSAEQKEDISKRLEKALKQANVQNEEFEKYRRDLLSDDYLIKPINNIKDEGFLSPADASQLSEYCLSMWKDCRFENLGDNSYTILPSDDVKHRLAQFLRKPGNETGYNELDGLLSCTEAVKVVFDGSIANDRHDHVFLSATGYWSKFLTHELEQEQLIKKTFSFGVGSSDINLPQGRYLVFLFEVRMEGVRKEIDFYGIPVDVQKQEAIETNNSKLPRILSKTQHWSVEANTGDLDVNYYYEVAMNHLEGEIDAKRTTAAEENRYIVESRVEALKKSSDMKIKGLQRRIENYLVRMNEERKEPNPKYIKLTTARIEKERSRLESNIKKQLEHQELTVDSNLGGIIYLEVV